jgi:predicted hotdog family 3-hydroxylacyl-ACP dehydratase
MEKVIERDALQHLVPHKGKMFLLTRVTDYDCENGTVSAEYEPSKESILWDEELGGVPAWSSFELMAQCISALSGLRERRKGREPKMGMLLSIADFVIREPLITGKVAIRVKEALSLDELSTFKCALFGDASAEAWVKARITVLDVDDIHKTLEKSRGKRSED